MNAQQLVAHGVTRSVKLSRAQAAAILDHHGDAAAEQITRAGALMDLAGAMGRSMDVGAALVCLERAREDYDLAAARLIDDIRANMQRTFNVEYTRLEKLYWSREAKARHASFVARLDDGALGWQASMLLLAAEDAGLTKPDAKAYRMQLTRVVGDEVGRRFPDRRKEWEVKDTSYAETLEEVTGSADGAHELVLRRAIQDEDLVRSYIEKCNPELEHKINALRSPRLVKDVTTILDKIRKRIAVQADRGWVCDEARYRKHVIEAARELARAAA